MGAKFKKKKHIQLLSICNKNLKITKCNKHLVEFEKTFCNSVCEDYLTKKLFCEKCIDDRISLL